MAGLFGKQRIAVLNLNVLNVTMLFWLIIVAIFPIIWFGVAMVLTDALDRFIMRPRVRVPKGENATVPIAVKGGVVLARRYGAVEGKSVIVIFPGMRGTNHFHKMMFLKRLAAEHSVYVLSYPGQEGAPGHCRATDVAKSLKEIVRALELHSGRPCAEMVFFGHCLGAGMAVVAAGQTKPQALVLVSLWMSPARISHLYLWTHPPWKPMAFLFPGFVFRMNGSIRQAIGRLGDVPVTIFQGERDQVAPIDDLRAIRRPNWHVLPVEGAAHLEVQWKCMPSAVELVAAIASSRRRPAVVVDGDAAAPVDGRSGQLAPIASDWYLPQ